jgi:hypothetical protein
MGQRKNPSWLLLRKGRLTASRFGLVLKAKKVTKSLLKTLTEQADLSKVKAIQWGIAHEQDGIDTFVETMGEQVQKSGLWLDVSGMLGASPDGLVGDDAVIEVKCPYSQRNITVQEAAMAKDFYIDQTHDGSFDLQKTHPYWHQIQGQLYFTGRRLCYLVVWTTQQTMIIEIDKDPEWGVNIAKLEEFYTNHMIPKLISDS